MGGEEWVHKFQRNNWAISSAVHPADKLQLHHPGDKKATEVQTTRPPVTSWNTGEHRTRLSEEPSHWHEAPAQEAPAGVTWRGVPATSVEMGPVCKSALMLSKLSLPCTMWCDRLPTHSLHSPADRLTAYIIGSDECLSKLLILNSN